MKKTKRIVLFGSALALIAALFTLAGCSVTDLGPYGKGGQSATPACTIGADEVEKTSLVQKSASFTLTSTHSGIWKAYRITTVPTGSDPTVPAPDVIVTFSAPILTLTSTGNDLPAGAYFVKVTEMGKRESMGLHIVVNPYGYRTLGGTVSIDGQALVGYTLTANISELVGLTGTTYYQWKSGDDVVGENSTYVPQEADMGKTITVRINCSHKSGSKTSPATPPVEIFSVAYTGLAAYLATISGDTVSSPVLVSIEAVDISSVWGAINNAVAGAGKFVKLYLSACTAASGTISGAASPSGNDMNVIKNNEYLKSIVLPSTLIVIGNDAFNGCQYLTSVSIPASVTSIGSSVFTGCTSLASISVDSYNSAYSSDEGVLLNKAGTMLILCPQGKSGEYILPDSVTTIEGSAFANCAKLTYVRLGKNVSSIGSGPFNGCSSLARITVPLENLSYTDDRGVLFNKSYSALLRYPEGRGGEYTISPDLTHTYQFTDTIATGAFRNCVITSVSIPSTVTRIMDYAFYGCNSLDEVTFSGTSAISSANFSSTYPFNGFLRTAYLSGGPGTYKTTTPASGSASWIKQ